MFYSHYFWYFINLVFVATAIEVSFIIFFRDSCSLSISCYKVRILAARLGSTKSNDFSITSILQYLNDYFLISFFIKLIYQHFFAYLLLELLHETIKTDMQKRKTNFFLLAGLGLNSFEAKMNENDNSLNLFTELLNNCSPNFCG